MTRQVLKMEASGDRYRVIRDETKQCPFAVYKEWYDYNKHGIPTNHSRLEGRYQNIQSCLLYLARVVE